jgi:hypothetical protein
MSRSPNKWVIIFWLVVIFLTCLSYARGEIILPVPHLLEYGVDIGVISGAKTCGQCSLEMCAAYLQSRAVNFDKVREINRQLDPNRKNDEYYLSHGESTTWDELVKVASGVYGFDNIKAVDFSVDVIKEQIKNRCPIILAIAEYGAIVDREDQGYTGGHFLVINGFTDQVAICQDPDNRQENVAYSWDEIVKANAGWRIIVGFKPMNLVVQEQIFSGTRFLFNFNIKSTTLPNAVIDKNKIVFNQNQEGAISGQVESSDNRVWNGKVVIHFARPPEESQPSLLNVKNTFFEGTLWQFLGPSVTYKAWVVEQTGNHLLLVEEKTANNIRIVDLMNCFLRQHEKTPVGLNCLVIETANVDTLKVEQPAIELANSWIYIDPYLGQSLYQAIRQKDQATININLNMIKVLPPLPPEITEKILADDKAKWFTP